MSFSKMNKLLNFGLNIETSKMFAVIFDLNYTL